MIKMLFRYWWQNFLKNFLKHTCKQVYFLYEVSMKFIGKIKKKMDEAFINHYGKSAGARVDIALLVEHDAAALLPESSSSHRYNFLANPRA